jgi:CRP/FNR family cyclic AMP-dependent transcriptional regulator
MKATVSLLHADPDLAAGLSPAELEQARRVLIAPALSVHVGPWQPGSPSPTTARSLGVIVIEGALVRTTRLDGRSTAHLFGEGDLLRPWADSDAVSPLPMRVGWTALKPTAMAMLDPRLTVLMARWPPLLIELSRRASWQTSRVLLQVALVRIPRIDERLLLLFWRLGRRWGRMTAAGAFVPLPLTHETIAALVGASRPPVSSALSSLARRGLLVRQDDGWLLDRSAEAQLTSAGREG